MNAPYDPLHEELERLRRHTPAARQNERPFTSDPEVKALAALARSLELARRGESVPHLTQVDVTLPTHPNGQASVSISGEHVQAGAVLLIDGQPVTATGSFQNGRYLFTLLWKGNQHPHSIGVMNPDGTVAQAAAITLHLASGNNGNSGGNGNGGRRGTPPLGRG